MSEERNNPFWDFSLRVYGRQGVAEACLRLQDRHGIDVNLLLYFCWMASLQPRAMDQTEIRQAIAATEDWSAGVVQPLRSVRRRMKAGFSGVPQEWVERLRSEVKRLELDCERCQQDVLFEHAARTRAGDSDCRPSSETALRVAETNVNGYLRVAGVTADAADRRDRQAILSGCFST